MSRLSSMEHMLDQGPLLKNSSKSGKSIHKNNTKSVGHLRNGLEPEENETSTELGNYLQDLAIQIYTKEELLDRLAAEINYFENMESSCDGSNLFKIYKPVSY